ncbi:MAG: hypothetical protein MJ177_04620 [Clostridia bacterium]|nr:hypothetical protein [Clostridia bacterium]
MKNFLLSVAVITIIGAFCVLALSAYQKSEETVNGQDFQSVFITAENEKITVYSYKKLLTVKLKPLIRTIRSIVFVFPGIISPLFFFADILFD